MGLLDKIIDDLREGEEKGKINVHAYPTTIHEIIRNIRDMYAFIDWTPSIEKNEFEFAIDGITLKFVHNIHVPKGRYALVNDSIYRASQFGPIHMVRVEQQFLSNEIEGRNIKDQINFCIANGLTFTIVVPGKYKDEPVRFELWVVKPYQYYFQRYGFTDEAYDKCKQIVLEAIDYKLTRQNFSFITWTNNN